MTAMKDAVGPAAESLSVFHQQNNSMLDKHLEHLQLPLLIGFVCVVSLLIVRRFTGLSETENPRIPPGYETTDENEIKEIKRFDDLQRIDSWIKWYYFNCNLYTAAITTGMHVLGFYGLTLLGECSRATLVLTTVCWFLACLGITAGSHRLWSHRSYEASLPYRFVIMIFASLANQGTIYHWVRDHRVHHRYSETKADPHNALRGMFFAHIGWLYLKKDPRVIFAGRKVDMSDIEGLPEVRLQKLLFPFWNTFWCFVVPPLISHFALGDSWEVALFVTGALRYVIVLHCTFLVNSAAHYYGHRPYEDINPTENPIVAFLSIGEGWHNYHHAYPFDYAASELGVSSQYNPTKLIIDAAAALGLVWNRRRATKQWKARYSRKEAQPTLEGYPFFKVRHLSCTKTHTE